MADLERRSEARLSSESAGEMEASVAVGIRARVERLLSEDSGHESEFSSSAAGVIRSMISDIILQKGSVVVKNDNDQYGQALVSRDWDTGEYTDAEFLPESKIVVRKIPVVSIPETPIDPDEVSARTDRGELKFEYTPSKTMAIAQFKNGEWGEADFIPSGSVEQGPLADRYGQAIFGGSRAVRMDDGRIALFRPDAHVKRFNNNAERECMPTIDGAKLIGVFKEVVRANSAYIGKPGEQSLYLAPGQRATRNQLGVKPNQEYLFTCLGIPAGKIFSTPAKLRTEAEFHRAAKGGFGGVKHSGNYSPTFGVKKEAHAGGYDDIVFLDEGNEELRELSSSNIFFITPDGVLVTPSLSGEILPGITRDSILKIAQELITQGVIKGVEARPIKRAELAGMAEGFSCGTGVTMNGIESIDDERSPCKLDVSHNGMGRVTRIIYEKFNSILGGSELDNPNYKDWMVIVE